MAGITVAQMKAAKERIVDQELTEFWRDILRPPHAARMDARMAEYVGRLGKEDRETFQLTAMQKFFLARFDIKQASDIERLWDEALQAAARSRSNWEVWSWTESRWVRVRPSRLRKRK